MQLVAMENPTSQPTLVRSAGQSSPAVVTPRPKPHLSKYPGNGSVSAVRPTVTRAVVVMASTSVAATKLKTQRTENKYSASMVY